MTELTKRSMSGLLGVVLALGALIFLPAWSVVFWQAWVYWLIVSGWLLFITAYFLKADPALVERRLRTRIVVGAVSWLESWWDTRTTVRTSDAT